MLKLVLSLVCGLLVAVLILQLRQQRLELNHQANQLHNQIEDQQSKLWNQQLQIAVYTAPNAIAQTVNTHALRMVPQAPLPKGAAPWLTSTDNPDAE